MASNTFLNIRLMEPVHQCRPFALPEGEVHLWFVQDQDLGIKVSRDFLDEMEAKRFAQYKTPGKQKEFFVGRWFVKQILSQYLDLSPTEIKFDLNAHGRPTLGRGLDVNLSHSFGGYVCIIGRNRQVGTDIEFVQRKVKTQSVYHVFSSEEMDGLTALEGAEQRHRFFQIWTLKEAIWKAIDIGVLLPFNSFYVSFDPLEVHTDSDLLPLDNWQLACFYANEQYMISTAIKSARKLATSLKCFRFLPTISHI